jgi:hypothetical protein
VLILEGYNMSFKYAPYIIIVLFSFFVSAFSFTPVHATDIKHIRPHNIPPAPRPPQKEWADASFYRWDSKQIIKAFEDNGLEVRDIKPGYTMVAPAPREATIFYIPSYGKNVGAYVSSYNNKEDLMEAIEYYKDMNKNKKTPSWRIYTKDNILLLISGKVPEEKAEAYEKVLKNLDSAH